MSLPPKQKKMSIIASSSVEKNRFRQKNVPKVDNNQYPLSKHRPDKKVKETNMSKYSSATIQAKGGNRGWPTATAKETTSQNEEKYRQSSVYRHASTRSNTDCPWS